MIDKLFGLKKGYDEASILDSLLEHTRIDEEEITQLHLMLQHVIKNDTKTVITCFEKIKSIHEKSTPIFESTVEQIIQAHFDHQKQYDLLRLFQRIQNISSGIISAARRLMIFNTLSQPFPCDLKKQILSLSEHVVAIHELFKASLDIYQKNKKNMIKSIHAVNDMENKIDDIRISCIETLYQMGNENQIAIGTFRSIEIIIAHFEELSDEIQDAATSLEWLLIY